MQQFQMAPTNCANEALWASINHTLYAKQGSSIRICGESFQWHLKKSKRKSSNVTVPRIRQKKRRLVIDWYSETGDYGWLGMTKVSLKIHGYGTQWRHLVRFKFNDSQDSKQSCARSSATWRLHELKRRGLIRYAEQKNDIKRHQQSHKGAWWCSGASSAYLGKLGTRLAHGPVKSFMSSNGKVRLQVTRKTNS